MIFAVHTYIAHLETYHTSFFGGFLPIFEGRCAHLSVGLEDLFKKREMNGIDMIFHHKYHQHRVASFSGEK